MNFLVESLVLWFVLAFVVGACGYATFLNNRKVQTLGITTALVLLVLIIGFGLYYGVDTDKKSIRRMLDSLVVAIENDDLEGVQKHIELGAIQTRALARAQMTLVRVPKANYKDLEISISRAVEPPIARIKFTGVVHWKTKGNIDGFSMEQTVPEIVRFDVELIKSDKTWLVTDNCNFTPRAGMM